MKSFILWLLALWSGILYSATFKVNIVGIDAKSKVWSGKAMISLVDKLSEAGIGAQIRSHFIPSPDKASIDDYKIFIDNDPDYIIFMDDFHYHFFGPTLRTKTKAKIGFSSLYAPSSKFDKFDSSQQFGVIQAPSHRNFELIRKYSKTSHFKMVGGPLAVNMGLRLEELAKQAGYKRVTIDITDRWYEFRQHINSADKHTLTLILAPFSVYDNGQPVSDLEFADAINSCPSPSVTIKDIKHADPLFTLTASPDLLGETLAKSIITYIVKNKNPGIIDLFSSGLTISRSQAKLYIKEFNTPEVVGFFRHH